MKTDVSFMCAALAAVVCLSTIPVGAEQRHVLENATVRIAFDGAGRVVEIHNKRARRAYMRPAEAGAPTPPFIVDAYSANQRIFIDDPLEKQSGGFALADPKLLHSTAKVGDLAHLTVDAKSPPTIRVAADKNGQTLHYACRLAGGIDLAFTVHLPAAGGVSRWRVNVNNTADGKPNDHLRVYRVVFPILPDLCIGGKPAENFLARTYIQGELIPNPSTYSFVRPGRPGAYINVLTYPGWASMPWMDLYQAPKAGRGAAGLYFASYDPTFNQTDLQTTADAKRGTITMSMRTFAYLEPEEKWQSQTFLVGAHAGDWHWAADRYRTDSAKWLIKRDVPDWIRDCDGWFGSGGPNYRYADLPKMLEDARWLGLNYLQCWSEMLENVGPKKSRKGYYCFFLPDPVRGGEKDMAAGVGKVRRMGGHIGFYSNFWTFDADIHRGLQQWKDQIPPDVKVPHWREFRKYMSVFPDGHMRAGDFTRTGGGYAGSCPGAEGWRDYLKFWIVDKYVRQYGVDAWYVDSFPVTMFGAARICFSPHHAGGRPHGVGPHLLKFARMIRAKSDPTVKLAVSSESVGDVFMQYNSHALGLEMVAGLTRYQKPEIYTYTFPHHAIFSGSCNGSGRALVHYYPGLKKVTRAETFNRVFLMGYRFDVLGHRLNRKNRDMLYLRSLIALRQKIKAHLYRSSLKDEIGLGPLPADVHARVFRHDQGKSLTVAFLDRRKDKAAFALRVDPAALDLAGLKTAALYTLDGRTTPLAVKTRADKTLEVALPARQADPAAVIFSK